MQTKVTFIYDEHSQKWEVIVSGVESSLEALQAFNAVVITCHEATPSIESNAVEFIEDNTYKISVGI